MSELINVRGATGIIPGSCVIGVVSNGDYCVLIDTGIEASVAKRALKALDAARLTVRGIINTHSHTDHCGGNRHIQKVTGAMAYASRFEGGIILNPEIEALYLTGALPPKPMRTKLTVAEPTMFFTELSPGTSDVEGVEFTFIPLPGHSPGHMGVLTKDNVLFFGDALVPAQVFQKYKLPFVTDIPDALASIDALEASGADVFVGSHIGVADDISALCEANRIGIQGGCDTVLSLLDGPTLREEALKKLFNSFEIPQNPVQWHLMLSCVSACLYQLYRDGRVGMAFEDGALMWKRL